MIFTIFFPGAVVAFAAEQWESACQSVNFLKTVEHPQWTMQNTFFADMEALPDFLAFPVDGQQLISCTLAWTRIPSEIRARPTGLQEFSPSCKWCGSLCNVLPVQYNTWQCRHLSFRLLPLPFVLSTCSSSGSINLSVWKYPLF